MRKLKVQEVKEIQLNILKVVTKYCDNNNLTYFLGYGTLLGAVRHSGYIPWDDDIDMLMPRLDYEKFIEEFKFNEYDVKSHYKDTNYPYKFAKVSYENSKLIENMDLKYNIGINIDVFPLDTFPNSAKKVGKLYRSIKFYDNLLKIKIMSINNERKLYKNIILKLGKIFLTPINYRKIISRIDKKAKEYSMLEQDGYMGCIIDTYSIKDIMNKRVFEEIIEVDFEGHKFYAPKDYHQYLSNVYGDYMKLPSEENRITHHDFEAFLK